jgi:hypothetical protein
LLIREAIYQLRSINCRSNKDNEKNKKPPDG